MEFFGQSGRKGPCAYMSLSSHSKGPIPIPIPFPYRANPSATSSPVSSIEGCSAPPHFLLLFCVCVQKYAHMCKVNLECCSLGDVTLVLRASLRETWDSRIRLGSLALEARVSCLHLSSPGIATNWASYVSSGDQT